MSALSLDNVKRIKGTEGKQEGDYAQETEEGRYRQLNNHIITASSNTFLKSYKPKRVKA